MDETELIVTLVSYLEAGLPPPVKTSHMEDERPVPVIIIEDWNTQDLNLHNSAWAGDAVGDFDDDGVDEYEWYLNFDWSTRVEILVRDKDEIEVNRLKDALVQELRLIGENPFGFHDDLKRCSLGSSGQPTSSFTEPNEGELMVSATFYGDHTITRKPEDSDCGILEQVKNDFQADLDGYDFTVS